MNNGTHALGTSFVLTRLGQVATTPPREQQLIELLQAAAMAAGCGSHERITALYVGLKLHLRICMYGPSRERSTALFEALTKMLVGSNSGQVLLIQGPTSNGALAQRFAAVRMADFVTTALEPWEQDKAWFMLVDIPGEPSATLRWLERELAAALQTNGRPTRVLPSNVFVLTTASERPKDGGRCWLPLAAPRWTKPGIHNIPNVLPVGYQRQLLDNQLTASVYRDRLQKLGPLRSLATGLPSSMTSLALRWLAASIDEQGRGLWAAHDPAVNAHRALAALEAYCR